jgi:hypothetical protein
MTDSNDSHISMAADKPSPADKLLRRILALSPGIYIIVVSRGKDNKWWWKLLGAGEKTEGAKE